MQAFHKNLILLAAMFWLATASQAIHEISANDDDAGQIQSLIEGLDAKKFAEREAATDRLVELGRDSLQPVAQQFFDANPELAWRIKRILKRVATEADKELTSLRAIGVLIALDQTVTSGELNSELSGLLTKWRVNRSERAIKLLVDRGAATSPTGVQRQLFLGDFNMQQFSFGGSRSVKKPFEEGWQSYPPNDCRGQRRHRRIGQWRLRDSTGVCLQSVASAESPGRTIGSTSSHHQWTPFRFWRQRE